LETQKTSNSQGNTEQKSNPGGITIPAFKLFFRTVAIKTVPMHGTGTKIDMKTSGTE
jgi:hypothetical protein